jgi:RNA polymerase sigma factor (sigma-70 family)
MAVWPSLSFLVLQLLRNLWGVRLENQMADESREFAALMQRVCAGSQSAARELVERYGTHILRIVRRNLNRKLRTKFDSADFVQAVWASFFALPLDRYNFDQSEALVGFLFHLARNKVVEAVRQRLQTQKYNVNRERPLDDGETLSADAIPGRDLSPDEIAIAREEWERLLSGQPEHYRQILTGLRDGESQQSIAEQMGLTTRTVRRVLRKIAPDFSDETRPPGPPTCQPQ